MPSSSGVDRVKASLAQLGIRTEVLELPSSTRTSADAAKALHCEVAQIAKTVVLRGQTTDRAILVVAGGSSRVSLPLVAQLAGEPVEKADADFVRERTGYAIGGVPPLALPPEVLTILDDRLLELPEVWAAAGSPHAVFRVGSAQFASAIQRTSRASE